MFMKRFICISLLLLAALGAHAQSKFNPNTQILGWTGPLLCADTSGSGTVQACSTVPANMTVAAGKCIVYTTTTANTGAGLTLNVNSVGAKSVAKWQGVTTLAVGDIAANAPVLACYDGTHWNVSAIANAPSGGPVPSWLHFGWNGLQVGASQIFATGANALNATITIPSGCTNSSGYAAVAATGSTAMMLYDVTTSTTLCTFTWAGSGLIPTASGSGGTISALDKIEWIGAATADATLFSFSMDTYVTH